MKNSDAAERYTMVICEDEEVTAIHYSDSECTVEIDSDESQGCTGFDDQFSIYVATCRGNLSMPASSTTVLSTTVSDEIMLGTSSSVTGSDDSGVTRLGFNFMWMIFGTKFGLWSIQMM